MPRLLKLSLCLFLHLSVEAGSLATPHSVAQQRRQRVVAAIKRFDQLEAMSSRGDPEGCSTALAELSALDAAGVTFALGPNAYNRAMRVCASDLDTVEELYTRLVATGKQDKASLEALASIRLDHDMPRAAASALAELLSAALMPRTTRRGRVLPLRKVRERTVRIAQLVLHACAVAGLADEEMSGAPQLWNQLGEMGLWAPPPPPPLPERTLALLKPDCTRSGKSAEVEALIVSGGFEIVRRRRWRMCTEEAARFLATSWGSAEGDQQRRFFSEMIDFYSSGEVLALLLEKDGAIGAWRELLGPGDPAVARGYTDRFGRTHRPKSPQSVRARFGLNKQANAAHGSDSPESAAREIQFVFGDGWSEARALRDDQRPT
jgi:nucleoside diphosphate kinase